MTVSELKQIVPLEDAYEIRKDARYIVRLPKLADKEAIAAAVENLKEVGLDCFVVVGNVEFFEVK